MSFKITKQIWFHKKIVKTFTRNTRINAKNLALDINVHWTFLRVHELHQKCTFQSPFTSAPFMVRHLQNPNSIVFQIPKKPSKTKHP